MHDQLVLTTYNASGVLVDRWESNSNHKPIYQIDHALDEMRNLLRTRNGDTVTFQVRTVKCDRVPR